MMNQLPELRGWWIAIAVLLLPLSVQADDYAARRAGMVREIEQSVVETRHYLDT